MSSFDIVLVVLLSIPAYLLVSGLLTIMVLAWTNEEWDWALYWFIVIGAPLLVAALGGICIGFYFAYAAILS